MKSTILLVDDDISLLEGMARVLRKEPYVVLLAGSAKEALELLETRPIDLIVSDEAMPGLSGTAFLRRVRERYPETVRFMLTGQATINVALDAINNGGISRFFIKPCHAEELALAIRQGLQHRELLQAARRLLHKGKRQSLLLEQLERKYPNITHVERDEDGAILLEDWNGDAAELMQEITAHLTAEK